MTGDPSLISILESWYTTLMNFRMALLLSAVLLCLTGYLVVKNNTLTLVNYVVCHAFLQKAPPELIHEEVRFLFQQAYQTSRHSSATHNLYMQELFGFSQKMEKLQRLPKKDAEELLNRIRSYIPTTGGANQFGRK